MDQVLMSFYVILYRVAMAEAKSEVNKTRHFVAMIPLHVLDREVYICHSPQYHASLLANTRARSLTLPIIPNLHHPHAGI